MSPEKVKASARLSPAPRQDVRPLHLRALVALVTTLGCVLGCTASIEPSSAAGPGPTGSGTAGRGDAPVGDTARVTLPASLRRLTNDEYRDTLVDLLGLSARPTDALVIETRQYGYDNFSSVLTVSPTLMSQYASIAERLAAETDVAKLAPCNAPSAESACARRFLEEFGTRAFRRPLSDEEKQAYLQLFETERADGGYADGIRTVLEAMLASPHFLYRSELGGSSGHGQRALSPYEVASELSYLITGSMPDAELFAAAAANRLGTPQELDGQARRLLRQPRAAGTIRKWILQWFGLSSIGELAKDVSRFPSFTPELRASMLAETSRFIDATLWERDATLASLMQSSDTFVDARLAKLYGASDVGSADTWSAIKLEPQQRAGILTQASVMAVHSKSSESFPIARGKLVRKNVLCQTLPPQPKDLKITPPAMSESATTRERFSAHSNNPACSGCHKLMDPIGFGFESLDAIGGYRSEENGKLIDDAGELTGSDVDGPFRGGAEVAKKLANSAEVAECAAVQAMRWSFGRLETDSERALAKSTSTSLGGPRMDLRALIVDIVTSDNFRFRKEQP